MAEAERGIAGTAGTGTAFSAFAPCERVFVNGVIPALRLRSLPARAAGVSGPKLLLPGVIRPE